MNEHRLPKNDLYRCELVPNILGSYIISARNYLPEWGRFPNEVDENFMEGMVEACLREGKTFEYQKGYLPGRIIAEAWRSIDCVLTWAE